MSNLAKNYNRKKISFKYGKGSYLYSTSGKKYLDFVMGIAVNSLGHAHPSLVKTTFTKKGEILYFSRAKTPFDYRKKKNYLLQKFIYCFFQTKST